MSWINKLRKQRLLSVSLFVFTLAAGVLIGTTLRTGISAARNQNAVADATPLVIPPAKPLTNDFVRIAKALEPSVVFITTDYTPKQTTTSRRRQAPRQEEGEDEIPELFRRFMDPFGGSSPDQAPRYRREGSGSGFIVDKNGYIVTNLHVVDEADNIKVRLTGEKTEYKAKLIGSDPEIDIAVIHIDAGKPLPPVRISNSDGVQVGDWAIAVGAPFGLETSVTAGIVSATSRDVGPQQLQRFIQTDAAINPGNSGGPLVNINGEVIGVNTMIATRSGGYQGIGFALPMNMVAKSYNSIVTLGRVARGSIGIRFDKEVKPETLRAFGLKNGVIISQVQKDGPADKAGLQAEDILIALNGKPIKDGDDLVQRISDTPIGQSVTITLDRDGAKLDKSVKVEDRAEVFKNDPQFARLRPEMTDPDAKSESSAKLGIGVRSLTEAERKELNFTDPHGVIVTAVEEGSFAEEIGLREKDIIVSINREAVSSFEDVKRLASQFKTGDAIAFRVMRPGPGSARGQTAWFPTYVSGTLR